jgi:hypothetical protein
LILLSQHTIPVVFCSRELPTLPRYH